jgi:hypothetical protein
MSLYINTSKKPIFEIIKKLDELIHSQNVINHISIRNYYLKEENSHLEDNKEINKEAVSLKAQFQKVFNSDTYQITYFDSYGRKSNIETFENKRDFKKAFYKYANGKLFSFRFNKFGKRKAREKHKDLLDTYREHFDSNKVLSYHKQRISKKLTSNSFVSNEMDLKIEVYNWLLKKNKDAVIIPEYSIGNRRADYISFDTKKIDVTIIEIKSELDTFDRLEAQLQQYSSIANNIYLALDIKQYEKLATKNILIPSYVGILIYNNSNKRKLEEIKKPSKNSFIKELPFIDFLSYNDINNAFTGFKYSSKFTKEQKQELMNKYIKQDILNSFSYDILCNRYIIESDKRKDLFYQNEFLLSASSSKELKINRFDVTGKYTITLSSYIKDKSMLYAYFIEQEQLFLKEFLDFPEIKEYIRIHNNKTEQLRKELRSKNIFIRGVGSNQIELMSSIIENKEEIIKCLKRVN